MGSTRIGIDLGTSNSSVSVYQNGKVEVLANDCGSNLTPSTVVLTEDEVLVGEAAAARATVDPENVIYGAKRLIGRRINDPTVQSDIDQLPYTVKADDDEEFPKVEVIQNGEKKELSPEEVSAMVVAKMKETAEEHLGSKVDKAVITVPASFTNAQREATIKAAELAGIEDVQLLNEPTAAGIAYGMMKEDMRGTILIYDLGGGTLDVSIVLLEDSECTVKATHGDTHLGGEDFTNRLVEYFVDKFQRSNGIDLKADNRAIARLRQECETAKKALSFAQTATVHVDAIVDDIDIDEVVPRSKFEDLNEDLFKSTLTTIAKALESATMTKMDIEKVVMVGGSSRIPIVQSLVKDFFSHIEVHMSINPDEAVGYGAGVYAAMLEGIKLKSDSDFTIQDIIPLSLGIEVSRIGNTMDVVIPKNSNIPISKTQRYYTACDNQTAVPINVYEGEDSSVSENNYLAKFLLKGIPKGPKGAEKLDVTFEIVMNGTLKVSAVSVSTGLKNDIEIDTRAKRATTLSET